MFESPLAVGGVGESIVEVLAATSEDLGLTVFLCYLLRLLYNMRIQLMPLREVLEQEIIRIRVLSSLQKPERLVNDGSDWTKKARASRDSWESIWDWV